MPVPHGAKPCRLAFVVKYPNTNLEGCIERHSSQLGGMVQGNTGKNARATRGVTTIQVLIILVPVIFGLLGFALDLGQLYLARHELKIAANAMALAAAQRLIGTDQGTTDATTAAQFALDNSAGFGDKYNFGALVIGQSNGSLNSSAPDPTYFTALQDALSSDGTSGGGDSTSRHAQVTLSADVPLTFCGFLPLATDHKVTVAARAVAGISAPLCTACSMEAYAVPALDPTDTTDFGFVPDNKYTLGYNCIGIPTPALLPGTVRRVEYLILNRLDTNAPVFTDENTQLFRMGAQGMPGNTSSAIACFNINAVEQVWADASPPMCSTMSVPQTVQASMCGLTTRFESTTPTICSGIPSIGDLSSSYTPDTDTTDIDTYTSYAGNGRRVITVSIVDTLNANSMTVLGFRQFLVDPDLNGVDVTPADANGRFRALYIGSVVPLKQGRFDGCQIPIGPGKVVLHQ